MTDENPIGNRIAAFRVKAGYRKAGDLADAIPNPKVTTSVIQNIESGRKADLSVTQLLEISFALGVSPIALLVPLDQRQAKVDLPGISEGISAMTVDEFDRWTSVWYDSKVPGAEHSEWAITTAAAIRQLRALSLEVRVYENRPVDDEGRWDALVGVVNAINRVKAIMPTVDLDWLPETLREEVASAELELERQWAAHGND